MYKVLNSSECRDEVKIIAKARRDAWKSKILPLVSFSLVINTLYCLYV